MSIEAAIESEDLKLVKKYRGVLKGQLSVSLDKFQRILNNKVGDEFNHANISKSEVQQIGTKLSTNYDLFIKLHDRYCLLREPSKNDDEELTLATADEEYTNGVSSKYFPAMDIWAKYKISIADHEAKEAELRGAQKSKDLDEAEKSLKLKAVIASIPDRESKFVDALDLFITSKQEALMVTKCLENVDPDDLFESSAIQIQPAHIVKQALADSFRSLLERLAELKYALKMRGDTDSAIEAKINFNRSNEQKEIGKINIDLSKILEAKKINLERTKLSASGPALSSTMRDSPVSHLTPIKLNKPDPIKFSGHPRDFATFKRDFEAIIVPNRSAADIGLYLKQAVPSKDVHILANVELENYPEMMNILSSKFGCTRKVVDCIITDIEKLKVVTTDRMFVDYVEKLERINRDISTIKIIDEIANATVISKLEAKLPVIIYKDWSDLVIEENFDEKTSREKFDSFMTFLSKKKKVVEYQLSDARNSSYHKSQTHSCYVTGVSAKVNNAPMDKVTTWRPCLACNVDGATDLASTQHSMERCEVWGSLSLREKERLVKCVKHPFKDDHTSQNCTVKSRKCKFCDSDSHHFLLCTKKQIKSSSNVSSGTNFSFGSKCLSPVLVQAQFVDGVENSRIGTLLDLGSTDDYVTHRYAKRKQFPSEDVDLIVEGIGGKVSHYKTKVYQVPIFDKEGKQFIIPCFGLNKISCVAQPPNKESYKQLCKKFDVSPHQVRRPQSIDLLLSMKHNFLHPQPVLSINGMVLYDGQLGKVFGGSDPDLEFTPFKSAYPSSVHVLHQSNVSSVHRSIGVECNPHYGAKICGRCATGAKWMSNTTKLKLHGSLLQEIMSVKAVNSQKKQKKKAINLKNVDTKLKPEMKKQPPMKESQKAAIKAARISIGSGNAYKEADDRKSQQDERTLCLRFSNELPKSMDEIEELHSDIKFIRTPQTATKKGDSYSNAFVDFGSPEECKDPKK